MGGKQCLTGRGLVSMQEENQSAPAGVGQHVRRRWCLFCHKGCLYVEVEQHTLALALAVLPIQKRFVFGHHGNSQTLTLVMTQPTICVRTCLRVCAAENHGIHQHFRTFLPNLKSETPKLLLQRQTRADTMGEGRNPTGGTGRKGVGGFFSLYPTSGCLRVLA